MKRILKINLPEKYVQPVVCLLVGEKSGNETGIK